VIMERAKSAIGDRPPSSARHAPARTEKSQRVADPAKGQKAFRKKAEQAKTKSGLPRLKNLARKPRAEKLACRYCGSHDLAPSFIKRRDRRCKCFSKRYGSAARGKKVTIKK
jgi:hypothetical protein